MTTAFMGILLLIFYAAIKRKRAQVTYLKNQLQEKNEQLETIKIKLNDSKLSLNRTLAELERFTYIASHDLKSPLRNIISFLTLIERKMTNPQDQNLTEYLNYAKSNAQQMHLLIQDVLEFSRVKSRDFQRSHIKMNEMMLMAVKNLQNEMQDKNAVVFSDDLPEVTANSTHVVQLLQNLMSNGIKYNHSPNPEIVVSHSSKQDYHVISVTDNGIGVAPEYHEKVFEMFKRLHSKEDYPGSGIGLAVCQKIIDNMGGDIWMDSSSGGGTTVHFSIPKV